MLVQRSPHVAYARVEFDARVAGAGAAELVALCFERLATSLDAALFAHGRQDNGGRSAALTKALAAVTALQLGVDAAGPVGRSLKILYDGARQTLLASALGFDVAALTRLRTDFAEVAEGLRG